MRRVRTTLLAVTVAVTLGASAGCGGSADAPRDTLSSSPGEDVIAPRTDPTVLVNAWYVDAPEEEDGAALIIGDRVGGGIVLFRHCGMLEGDWRANGRAMFVASFYGGDGSCFDDSSRGPNGWWNDVTGYAETDEGVLLTGTDGATVARLSPGAHPTAGPDASAEYASPPMLTPEVRSRIADPAPLPDGLTAASADDLIGRWIPTDAGDSEAHVVFDDDTTYSGSDGCNDAGGRYVVGPDGLFLATSGPTTLIGCDGSQLSHSLSSVTRVGLRAGRLVLVDAAGKTVGEARPA